MSENIHGGKVAIILLNLGGPNDLNSIKPFLFNLFYDQAIINLPNPLRFITAKALAFLRESSARNNYLLINGKSPLLDETIAQKKAITEKLQQNNINNFKVFICMRHWHPRSEEVAKKIKYYQPNQVILVPLYPHFSSTTTGSAIKDITTSLKKYINNVTIKTLCCYYSDTNFIDAHVLLLRQYISKVRSTNYCVLFSAHSVPQNIIRSGDPYQWQLEQTVYAIVNRLEIDNLDYTITYQSKIGFVKWLEPDTKQEIINACVASKTIIIVPIAFVSEHIETLVELDVEYFAIAKKYNVDYFRVPTLQCNDLFISSIANSVQKFIQNKLVTVANNSLKRACHDKFAKCIGISS